MPGQPIQKNLYALSIYHLYFRCCGFGIRAFFKQHFMEAGLFPEILRPGQNYAKICRPAIFFRILLENQQTANVFYKTLNFSEFPRVFLVFTGTDEF
jgi:hypothetical protein